MMSSKRFSRVLSLAVVTVVACGAPDDGTDTDPVSLQCGHQGVLYEPGEEFTTGDGCVTYRCEDSGTLTPTLDNRITIAGDLDLPTAEDVAAQACVGVVEGSLTISGTAADLSALGQLTRIGGTLDISASDTVTLHGLEALTEVGAGIIIADNAALTSMSFMPNLSVFGGIEIRNNDALVSLAGAEFLSQCQSCSAIMAGNGDGQAAEAPGFGDEGGVPGGTFYGNILIADNDVLSDLRAMSNLVFAWESVRFRNNAALTDLSVLQLSEVRGDLEITDHAALAAGAADAFAARIDVWGMRLLCGNMGGAACPE